jgi:lamin tail-like protein
MKTVTKATAKAMPHPRVLLLLLCLGCTLLTFFPARIDAISTSILISEFRTRGPNGGNDELIELFNASSAPVNIGGWQVKGSNSLGGVSVRATINSGVLLNPGCHYLLTNSNSIGGPYSGGVQGDQPYSVGITDDGGIAVTMPDGTVIDQVGLDSGSSFKEGATLTPLTTSSNRGYERRPGGAAGSSQDTDNNQNDFHVISPSAPENARTSCLSAGAPSNPTGVGAAVPASVAPGNLTLLTVVASLGSNPTSTNISVTGNLSPIGESSTQSFFDDGTHGDLNANDGKFSFQATVGSAIVAGSKTLTVTIADGQGRSSSASISLTIESSAPSACGVERWSVKTGTDMDAFVVDLNTILPTTIAEMRSWIAPTSIPMNSRIVPQERTVYAVSGTLTDYKLEDDSDYHLVIRDQAGNTIITEIPCPCCVAAASPFSAKVIDARRVFDAHFTATGSFQTANVPVVIKGVGFFDFIHGQRGVAPNGIELHPVLDLTFDVGLATPVIISVEARGKKLFISGLNFDDGAVLLINGDKQKTRNDETTPATFLIAKKAANFITPGETVKLQIRNAGGQLSQEFSFTRPTS